jgi:hypothetical protein
MTASVTTVIAYWLVPAEPARSFFSETIAELASRFDAPLFTPHLTLFVTPENSTRPTKVVKKLGDLAIHLPIVEVSFSEQFTKTLFLRFEKTDVLQRMSALLRKLIGAPEHDLIDPHLSLLYQHLPTEKKRELADSMQLPFCEVTFDSVCAMRCVSPTQTAADLRAWKLA